MNNNCIWIGSPNPCLRLNRRPQALFFVKTRLFTKVTAWVKNLQHSSMLDNTCHLFNMLSTFWILFTPFVRARKLVNPSPLDRDLYCMLPASKSVDVLLHRKSGWGFPCMLAASTTTSLDTTVAADMHALDSPDSPTLSEMCAAHARGMQCMPDAGALSQIPKATWQQPKLPRHKVASWSIAIQPQKGQ